MSLINVKVTWINRSRYTTASQRKNNIPTMLASYPHDNDMPRTSLKKVANKWSTEQNRWILIKKHPEKKKKQCIS